MPDIAVITSRKIFMEDLEVTTSPNPTPSTQEVMGIGPTPLTPISVVLYASFGQYANDSAAAAGGVGVGFLYYNTSSNLLKTRMS